MAVFCLGMACLAAAGLDSFRRLSPTLKYSIVIAIAVDLVVAGAGRPMKMSEIREEPGFSYEQISGRLHLPSELRRLTRLSGPPWRVDTYQDSVTWSTTAPLTGIPTANGYNPLAPERLIQVRLSFARGRRWATWFQVEDLDPRIVDLLGIRYIVTPRPLPGATLDTSKYLEAGVFHSTFVYENRTALPRFWRVDSAR